MRTEKDFIGELQIPEGALYGIHSVRAKENFPYNSLFDIVWYKATAQVKHACYLTYKSFGKALLDKYKPDELPITLIPDKDRKSTRLNSSHRSLSRMPSSA